MIKNRKLLEQFNCSYIKNKKYTLEEKFEIYEDLYKWAKSLGVFPLKNPLEGITSCLRIAKALNYKKK